MMNLFRIEFLLYRDRALLAALVHMAVLASVQLSDKDINSTPIFPMWWLASMAASAGFGIQQMNRHKRINHWIYLLQRPLAPWKIATAIIGAGCAHILIALALPFALNTLRLQLAPAAGIIELRHYLQLGQIVPALLLIYVYAGFSTLYTHKFKYVGFAAFIGPLMNLVVVDTYLILFMLACTIAVCFYSWFKANLDQGATAPAFIVMSELPLQLGMFWVAVFIYSAVAVLARGDPAPGTVAALRTQDGHAVMAAALDLAAPADAAFYQRQLKVGDVVTATPSNGRSFPNRNQRPSLDNALLLNDPVLRASWRFSHSAMLFKGVDPRSDTVVGWLGPQGFSSELSADAARFTSVPWTTQDRFILDDTTIYQIDWEQRALRKKFTIPSQELHGSAGEAERFSDSLGIHPNFVTLMSNHNLYLFRSRQFNDFNEAATLEARLPLPSADAPTVTYVMELIDGYLVAQLTGVNPDTAEGDFAAFGKGGLFLHATGVQGNTLLGGGALASGFNASDIYEGFVIAPGFRLLNTLVKQLTRDWNTEEAFPLLYHRFPPLVLVLALCSMLVSGVVVGRLLRPIALPRAAKVTWVALCTFSGLLGLASFYLGTWRGGLSMQVKASEETRRA
jgi:hypothetical protein